MRREHIIVDSDPGIDDALALLLAARSMEIALEGVTITPGNVDTEKGALNAIRVLELVEAKNVSVHKGAKEPLKRRLVPAYSVHGKDGLGDCGFPEAKRVPDQMHAVDFILQKAESMPGEITIVCLGPLTNIALAIEANAEVMKQIKSIAIMGGAVKVPGNVSPVAEFNIWTDPEAASLVFSWGCVPITLVPLDVTRAVWLSPNHRELLRHLDNPVCHWTRRMTRPYLDAHWRLEGKLGCTLNDPLAIGVVALPELFETYSCRVEVATEGLGRGQLVVNTDKTDTNQKTVRVVSKVKDTVFVEQFLARISGNLTVAEIRKYLPC